MKISIQLTPNAIPAHIPLPPDFRDIVGAWVEFRGVVRNLESGTQIIALEYEAYEKMAISVMHKIVEDLGQTRSIFYFAAIHRIGIVPVGESAIYAGVAAKHRGQAFDVLSGFMDRLKQDVPIWKTRAIALAAQSSKAQFEPVPSFPP